MKKTKEQQTVFVGSKVIVSDQALASTLSNKGSFGTFVNGKLELSIEEAVYLNERKELKIYDKKGKELKFHELLEMAKKKQNVSIYINKYTAILYSIYEKNQRTTNSFCRQQGHSK